MNNNKTFIRITNKDIFDELKIIKVHVIKTNGNVTVNKWVSRCALTMSTFLCAAIIYGKLTV